MFSCKYIQGSTQKHINNLQVKSIEEKTMLNNNCFAFCAAHLTYKSIIYYIFEKSINEDLIEDK